MDITQLSDEQKKWLRWMSKGYGLSAKPKEFTAKERKEMEQLIEAGYATHGKNHSNDKTGMYHCTDEQKERVRELLKN